MNDNGSVPLPLIKLETRHSFEAKFYLNGFPKSGLHILALMVRPLAEPIPEMGMWDRPWAGTYHDHSWTNRWKPLEQSIFKMGRLTANHYVKAHCGYNNEVERFLYYFGACHVFVYRDFRDVAVSQAYHILHEDEVKFVHDDKEMYRALGGFDEVLAAVISGHDRYPGVMERWEDYAPWLQVPWVLRLRYEDLRTNLYEQSCAVLDYALNRVAKMFNREVNMREDVFHLLASIMTGQAEQHENSPTFRKGAIGDWKEHFTDEHKDRFKESDANGWLVKLGYEQDDDW